MWKVSRQRMESLLQLASEKVPCGIYAIRKGPDYYELKNHPMTKTQMKRIRNAYKAQGIKVYCNGI